MSSTRKPSGYASTLRYLYGLQYRGIKVGLKNIRALTASVGHPERTFPCFHCAGTNGKGSTSSFLASILTESGYRTGLYTSPHLVEFVERIRIDGIPIPEAALVEYTRKLRPVIDKTGATFFEATTCIAFQYFADQEVDVAVIETGLGGRLDATNVVMPLVSIITNVGLEHQDILGKTIRKIAREKAGIIKPGSPVVTGAEGEALEVIRQTAKRVRTSLYVPRDAGFCRFVLGLPGNHQLRNAQLALGALSLVHSRGLFDRVTLRAIERGLARVVENTGLRGRMELVHGKAADYVIDVGHNPAGIETAVAAFQQQNMRFPVAVFGAMKDKDTLGMLDAVRKCADKVVIVRPRIPRAETVTSLVRKGRQLGMDVEAGGTVERGIKLANALVKKGNTRSGAPGRPPAGRRGGSRSRATVRRRQRILIIGSHYVAGEALSALQALSAVQAWPALKKIP
jgi:dihydrofolate synthase/folylpolyglutamate synthase